MVMKSDMNIHCFVFLNNWSINEFLNDIDTKFSYELTYEIQIKRVINLWYRWLSGITGVILFMILVTCSYYLITQWEKVRQLIE